MNYQRQYDRLIEKYGTLEKPKGLYTERHRKLPGYLGGKYVEGNAFYMRARAHYVAHVLWAKITHDFEAWCAVKRMGAGRGRQQSKMYAVAREVHAKGMSARFSGENHPMYGKSPSDESRHKMSVASLGKPKSEQMRNALSVANKGHPVPEETREALRRFHTGRKASESSRAKMSASLRGNSHARGYRHTEETKEVLRLAGLGKTWSEESRLKASASAKLNAKICPVCGCSANPGNMARHIKKYHTNESVTWKS